MSIDLDWLKLDGSLANHLVDVLNRQLDNAERPSFIGPVQVISLDFGSNAPNVEIVDLRDIYRDFLEDDDDEERGPVKVTEGGVVGTGPEDEDGFEWVSRRAGVGGNQQYLPPHVRHHGYAGSGDYFAATAIPAAMDPWSSGLSRPPCFADYGMHSPRYNAGTDIPVYRSPSPATPFVANSPSLGQRPWRDAGEHPEGASMNNSFSAATQPPSHIPPPPQEPPPNPHPNLQLHLQINWHSNLRISLQTSLLINYPSPMFMSLPIRLSITGLVFNGELAVAYEGERRRVHLCILDDLDPYGPAAARKSSTGLNLSTGSNSSLNSNNFHSGGGAAGESEPVKDGSNSSTPPELEDSITLGAVGLGVGGLNSLGIGNSTLSSPNPIPNPATDATSSATGRDSLGNQPPMQARRGKPVLSIGQRLLPSIFIESEIGQTDKHVLKNVTRVEKFIQDVIRKTVEEELVFPNFHTLAMGEG